MPPSVRLATEARARSAMLLIEIIVMTARTYSSLSPPAPSGRQGDQSEAYRDHRQNAEQGPKHGTRLPHGLTPSSHAASASARRKRGDAPGVSSPAASVRGAA